MSSKLPPDQKRGILVQMNFPAPPITLVEVEKILQGKLGELDEHWIKWLEYFFGFPRASFTKESLERFCEINTSETFMNIVPSIEKVLKPIKDSCKAYSLGMFSASIALSGIATESLEILLWEMFKEKLTIDNESITKDQEKKILGMDFERLPQNKRIEILHAFHWINEVQKSLFDQVKEVRNRYLHTWNLDSSREKEEALMCYRHAFKLFRDITGVKLKDASSIDSNPAFAKWMTKNIT